MDKYLSENKKLYFCFVDFMKAYDSIWHEALFEKFLVYGVSTTFVSSVQMHRFSFKKEPLEICKLFPCLGTIITNNGNFKVNIQELCKSARRAIYTLLGSTNILHQEI